MAERSAVWRYSYWSDQKARDLAADNAIDLDRVGVLLFELAMSASEFGRPNGLRK